MSTAIATILVLLSLVGFLLGILGVLKGNVKFLKLRTRKSSFLFVIASFVVFIGGAMIMPVDDSPEVSEKPKTQSVATEKIEKKEIIKEEPVAKETKTPEPAVVTTASTPKGFLEVHFVDVGQGAAQVIIAPNKKVMVIDGGNNDDEDLMVSYLTDLGIKKIDILVGTHPDADHIGGIDAVINAFDIGKIYMPKVQSNTITFESVLTAIQNKGLAVSTAKSGLVLDLDSSISAKMIAPLAESSDKNEMSAIVRLQFGSQSFLLTGDAGVSTEADLISAGETLQSTVLLVGHHGSEHSTSDAFLKAVQPRYAVIQVGKNSYGHPKEVVLSKLANTNAEIFRNDTEGTIVFKTNGETMEVNKNAWAYQGPKVPAKTSVIENTQKNAVAQTPTTTSTAEKGLTASASIDNAQPKQNGTVNVTVTVKDVSGNPVSGAHVSLNLHFKSTDTVYEATTNASGSAILNFKVGRAAKGFTVNGDITVNAGEQSASTTTAFTPL